MYTVSGQQIRDAIKSEQEQAELKRSTLGKLRITGSGGQQILGSAGGGSAMDSFSITETLHELLNPTCGMTDEEKQVYMTKVMQKLKQGKKLTGEEMAYLQMTNPTLYIQAARIQTMRESLEKQLENCESRQEVQEVYGSAISHISDKDPMKEAVVAALGDAMEEFKKSDKFMELPNKKEEKKDKKKEIDS